jgi:hypothetical protein
MKLSQLKKSLLGLETIHFSLPNGRLIPEHFHITEMGRKTKEFIDCGNTIRRESLITFQIWVANDYEHRLTKEKFQQIILAAEPLLGEEDLDIEVEYQTDLTLGVFELALENEVFILKPKETNCLAKGHCGIPEEKLKINLSDLSSKSACTPGGGCC